MDLYKWDITGRSACSPTEGSKSETARTTPWFAAAGARGTMGCGGSKSALQALNQNTKDRLYLEGYGITSQGMCDISASLRLNSSVR